MAVFGHAWVGWGTGLALRPPADSSRAWIPAAILLAYLPDLAAQGLLLAGVGAARLVTHSVLFAAGAPLLLGWLLGRVVGGFKRWAQLIVVSVTTHDLLDLLQATDRRPLWPLSNSELGLGLTLTPGSSLEEAALYACAFGLVAALRARSGRAPVSVAALSRGQLWPALAVVALMAAAGSVHTLRDRRERALDQARVHLSTHSWSQALAEADRAGRWPSTAHPGRLEYVRAEAFKGIGDRERAEAEYRKSLDADPGYFWAAADLAVLVAESEAPLAAREAAITPLLRRLRTDFARQPELAATLERIDRRLGRPDHPRQDQR